MIVDEQVALVQTDELAGLGNLRNANQAVSFIIDYGRTENYQSFE